MKAMHRSDMCCCKEQELNVIKKKADFQIHHQWNKELFSELRLFVCLFVFVYFLKPAYSSFSRRIPYLPHTGQCT